jgi:hypothetical protein
MQDVQEIVTGLEHTFRWVPDWVVGLVLITAAIAVGLVVNSNAPSILHSLV